MSGERDMQGEEKPGALLPQGTLGNSQKSDSLVDTGRELDFESEETLPPVTCCNRTFPTGYWSGLKQVLHLTWGLILVQMCQIVIQPVTIIFAGHLSNKLILDTAALGQTLINITGYSIVWGMGTACDTLFSQTIGSGNMKLVGVQLQRGLVIQSLALCVCWTAHLNTEGLLILMGQDREVARETGRYMLLFMPGMFCLHFYVILRKWIQCQNIVNPMIAVGAIGLGAHILIQWLFIYVLDWGIVGSVLGLDVVYFLLLAMTVLYVFISGIYKDTWGGWDIRIFSDWGEYTRLAMFGLLMTCLEWWAFEVTVILAGTIGTTELGAQSVIFSVDAFIFGIPSGIAVAITIRVGQCLGAGRPKEAMTAARIGFTIGALLTVVIAVLLVVFRREIPLLLTNVMDVVDLVATVIPIVAYYSVADAFCAVARGIMRGCGKQATATVIIFIGFYLLALPIGISLLYLTSLKTIGLWIGLATALTIDATIYIIYINLKFDWNELSREARERARVEELRESECKPDGEHTPLLRSSQTKAPADDTGDEDIHVSKSTIMTKLLIILAFVVLLGVGVICRLFIPLPPMTTGGSNCTDTTDLTNATLYSYVPMYSEPLCNVSVPAVAQYRYHL